MRYCALAVLSGLALTACKSRATDAAPSLASSAPAETADASALSAPTPSGSADSAEVTAAFAHSGEALVDLAGVVHLPPGVADGATKLAARALLVPIQERPATSSRKIGYLRAGAIVEASATDQGHDDCSGGWRAIKPVGFVCLGDKATMDLDDPIVRASARRPDITTKLPYMYGTVTRGGPVYSRIPTAEDIKQFEPGLSKHIAKWKQDEVSGAGYGLDLWYKWKDKPTLSALDAWDQKITDSDIPFFLKDGATVPNLSGLVKGSDAKIGEVDHKQGAAFIDSFLYEGRRYNVRTDLGIIPGDRYRPIKGSDHHGVEIGKDVEIPFALIRKPGAKKWTFQGKGSRVEDGDIETWTPVNLTGKQKVEDSVIYYETKEGFFVDDRHASRVDMAKHMPKWGSNGERWIDVNITKQILVAYDGTKPVYATLVSTGEDGLEEGEKSTKKGIFRIHTKYLTTTMDSKVVGEEFELRDVPYVQYFEEGFALHGAYWHDGFGTPKSHGCVNLTPEDARRLFFFTEPQVPYGWHGAAKALTGSVVFVHP